MLAIPHLPQLELLPELSVGSGVIPLRPNQCLSLAGSI